MRNRIASQCIGAYAVPMIISHGRKYIFVHIPKTGGTSLALALESKAMKDDIMLGDTPKARNRRNRVKDIRTRGRLWKHSRLRDVYGLIDQAQINSYFIFTLVRNPWDRMVSYYHWLRTQNFNHPAVITSKQLEFDRFLVDSSTQSTLRNDAVARYTEDINQIDQCKFHLRLEHISEDLQLLEQRLDLRLPDISHENRSERRANYQSYYTASSKDIVGSIFSEDIKRFSYRFD